MAESGDGFVRERGEPLFSFCCPDTSMASFSISRSLSASWKVSRLSITAWVEETWSILKVSPVSRFVTENLRGSSDPGVEAFEFGVVDARGVDDADVEAGETEDLVDGVDDTASAEVDIVGGAMLPPFAWFSEKGSACTSS